LPAKIFASHPQGWGEPGVLAVFKRRGYLSDMSERIEINPRVCGGQPEITALIE